MIREGKDTYGRPRADWEEALTEATVILRAVAREAASGDKGLIYYSDLTKKITAIPFHYHSDEFDHFLGQISEAEHKEGKPLLTAIVIHKTGDYRPGLGFWRLAE